LIIIGDELDRSLDARDVEPAVGVDLLGP